MTSAAPSSEGTLVAPARWGVWTTLLWSVLIAAIYIVVQGLTLALLVVASHQAGEPADTIEQIQIAANNGTTITHATFATTLICGGLLIGVIKLKRGAVLIPYLCIKKVSFPTIIKWIGLTAVLITISDATTILLGRSVVPEFSKVAYETAHPVWLLWVAFVVAAPVLEEAFFRGFLFNGLESSFMKSKGAILVTAALWAATHIQYDVYIMIMIFCSGIMFGAARVFTGSLLVPMALHMFTNLVATLEAAILP
jgi:uncharacterized protein